MQVTFSELMGHLRIPEKLQDHLIWVAAVGERICDQWVGPVVNRDRLRRVLLLHDVGNVVKMDPMSDFESRLKDEYLATFGSDDHRASEQIAQAAGLGKDEIELMSQKVFVRNDETVVSNDWERKIGAYADQRVAPDGIYPLLERLEDARARYVGKPGSSMNNPRTDFLIACAVEIERQIFVNVDGEPDQITTGEAEGHRRALMQTAFELPLWRPSSVS